MFPQIKEETNHLHDGEIFVYHRVLKFPPFPAKKVTFYEHLLKDGKAIMESLIPVNVKDWEKFLAVLYLQQKNSHKVIMKEMRTQIGDGWEEVVVLGFWLKDVAQILNSHDYPNIVKAFENLCKITLKYVFYKKNKELLTHPLLSVKKTEKGFIILLIEKFFWEISCEHSLKINFEVFKSLKGVAKNLYCYLTSNPASEFKVKTLIQRAGILAKDPYKAKQQLKETLSVLVEKGILCSFEFIEDKVKIWR
ncbi:MAG: hypothetical protein J7K20_04265 [Thermodesulfobacterium sp.]|nr:hypothetical protein [Thermodesulfobacterium sp.]